MTDLYLELTVPQPVEAADMRRFARSMPEVACCACGAEIAPQHAEGVRHFYAIRHGGDMPVVAVEALICAPCWRRPETELQDAIGEHLLPRVYGFELAPPLTDRTRRH